MAGSTSQKTTRSARSLTSPSVPRDLADPLERPEARLPPGRARHVHHGPDPVGDRQGRRDPLDRRTRQSPDHRGSRPAQDLGRSREGRHEPGRLASDRACGRTQARPRVQEPGPADRAGVLGLGHPPPLGHDPDVVAEAAAGQAGGVIHDLQIAHAHPKSPNLAPPPVGFVSSVGRARPNVGFVSSPGVDRT